MPITTRQTTASGEGQDSRIDEQLLVEALPAVVQTAIADIEDKFSSRLIQVEQGFTSQFDEIKQLLQSRPELPPSASAAAPPAQPTLPIRADNAESSPHIAHSVSAEIGRADIHDEFARLWRELQNIRERPPFSPDSINANLEGFPDRKFTVHNGSSTDAGQIPYSVVGAWDKKKAVTLELCYFLGSHTEGLLFHLLNALEAVKGPDYDESDIRDDYEFSPDDARLLFTAVRTALIDRVRGLHHIYELQALLYDILSGTDDSKFNTALVRHELKDRGDYLSSAQLHGRTETARRVELEASARILERSIEQRIRNLSANDDRDRTAAKKAQDAKRRAADAKRTAAAKSAAKDRESGQSDATHNPRSRGQSRGRADAKDDVGAAK
jgi:hypothetical protein